MPDLSLSLSVVQTKQKRRGGEGSNERGYNDSDPIERLSPTESERVHGVKEAKERNSFNFSFFLVVSTCGFGKSSTEKD